MGGLLKRHQAALSRFDERLAVARSQLDDPPSEALLDCLDAGVLKTPTHEEVDDVGAQPNKLIRTHHLDKRVAGPGSSAPSSQDESCGGSPRKQREFVYIRRPLSKFQPFTTDVSNSFWRGTFICFWGYAKVLPSSRADSAGFDSQVSIVHDFDDLPRNWVPRFQSQALHAGANVIVGADESVFQEVLNYRQRVRELNARGNLSASQKCRLPATCVHVCRLFEGRRALTESWKRWIQSAKVKNFSAGRPQTRKPSLYQSLEYPVSKVDSDYPYPQPNTFHRITSPMWLQYCVNDQHHYPECSFPFFRPPAASNDFTPWLLKHRGTTTTLHNRPLSVMIFGTTTTKASSPARPSRNRALWVSVIEVCLGGKVLPLHEFEQRAHDRWRQTTSDDPAESKFVVNPDDPKNPSFTEPFTNVHGVVDGIRINDSPDEYPELCICLGGDVDVFAFMTRPSIGDSHRVQFDAFAISQISDLLHNNVPFLPFSWVVDAYRSARLPPVKSFILNRAFDHKLSSLAAKVQNVMVQRQSCTMGDLTASKSATPPSSGGVSSADNVCWWKANASLFGSNLVVPALDDEIPGNENELNGGDTTAPCTEDTWEEVFGVRSSQGSIDAAGCNKTYKPLYLAISPQTVARFPNFPSAAFLTLRSLRRRQIVLTPGLWLLGTLQNFFHEVAPEVRVGHKLFVISIRSPDEVATATERGGSASLTYDIEPMEACDTGPERCCYLLLEKERETFRELLVAAAQFTCESNPKYSNGFTDFVTSWYANFKKWLSGLDSQGMVKQAREVARLCKAIVHRSGGSYQWKPMRFQAGASPSGKPHLSPPELPYSIRVETIVTAETLQQQCNFQNVEHHLHERVQTVGDHFASEHRMLVGDLGPGILGQVCQMCIEEMQNHRHLPVIDATAAVLEDCIAMIKTNETMECGGLIDFEGFESYSSQVGLAPLEFEIGYRKKRSSGAVRFLMSERHDTIVKILAESAEDLTFVATTKCVTSSSSSPRDPLFENLLELLRKGAAR